MKLAPKLKCSQVGNAGSAPSGAAALCASRLSWKPSTDERAFFETGNPIRPIDLKVSCLWLMPLIAFILGLSMWMWALILRLIFPE